MVLNVMCHESSVARLDSEYHRLSPTLERISHDSESTDLIWN